MYKRNRILALGLTAGLLLSLTGCENAGSEYLYDNATVESIRNKALEAGNYGNYDYEEDYGYEEDGYGQEDTGEEYDEVTPGSEYYGFEEDSEIEALVQEATDFIRNLPEEEQPSLQKQEEVTDDTVLWMNATYMPWTKTFAGDMEQIGGMPEDENSRANCQEMLSQDWNVENKADVSVELLWLLEAGHRELYQQGAARMRENGIMDLTEEDLRFAMEDALQSALEDGEAAAAEEESNLYMTLAAYRAYHSEEMHGIDAWDYVRAMQVTAMAYQSGYYSLEETLDVSLLIAKIMQAKWDSWDAMFANYLYGYDFFAGDDPDVAWSNSHIRREFAEELKTDPVSPYQLDWDTQLTPGWMTALD